MANLPLLPDAARRKSARFVNADGTSVKTLFTCAAKGGFIEALHIASNHNTAGGIWVTIFISDGTADHFLRSVLVPAVTASAPVQVINVLDPIALTYLDSGNVQYRLGGGDMIKARCETAIPIGNYELSVTAQYGEYPVA